MARCEDFPCCGHTAGDPCPERDKSGRIVPRCCVCDKKLMRGTRSSICRTCQVSMDQRDEYGYSDDGRDY